MMSTRELLGAALIAGQLLGIALGQLGEVRYALWAPLHEQVRYHVRVDVAGRQLTAAEIEARYGQLSATRAAGDGEYWELNAIEHVFARVARREAESASEHARVAIRYRRNGGEPESWTWPR